MPVRCTVTSVADAGIVHSMLVIKDFLGARGHGDGFTVWRRDLPLATKQRSIDGSGRYAGARLTTNFLLAVLTCYSTPVHADVRVTGQVRLTSDYVYRGYSRSDNGPSFQGNLDFEHDSGLFAGAWVSTVDFTTMDSIRRRFEESVLPHGEPLDSESAAAADLEVRPYLGWHLKLDNSWSLNAAVAGYLYNGDVLDTSYDYIESYLQLHYLDRLSFRVGVAPDAYGYAQTGTNVEIQFYHSLNDSVQLTAGLGYDTVTALPGHSQLYWTLGATWYVLKHVALELRYFDGAAFSTGGEPGAPAPPGGGPVIASLSFGF